MQKNILQLVIFINMSEITKFQKYKNIKIFLMF